MSIRPQTGVGYKILLLLVDLGLAYLALWIALTIRYPETIDISTFIKHLQPFTVVYLIWIALFYFNNLYNFVRIKDQLNVYFDLARTLFVGTVIGVIVFYILPSSDLAPKRLLLMNAGIFALLVAMWRIGFMKIFHRLLPRNNVAIVGINLRSLELGKLMLTAKNSGYKLVALVGNGEQKVTTPPNLDTVTVIENPYELSGHIGKSQINTIILADNHPNQSLIGHLFEYLPLGVKFYNLPDFYEEYTYKIPTTYLDHGWFLANLNENDRGTLDMIKRLTDIVVATTLLIVFFPIMVITAIIILIDDPKESFIYTQKRIGLNNKIFWVYKLKTMKSDAEIDGVKWAQENDPRTTRVGGFLRRTRLNEVPQLINIFKGEMSLVGPRPERPESLDELVAKVPFFQVRHLIKPGLTGWAQVKFPYGASISDTKEKLQYDLYYMKHRSLSLDLSILIRTLIIAFGFRGR